MHYRLSIKRLETNVYYQDELKKWEEQQRYRSPDPCFIPQQQIEKPALEVILNEEEFTAVKKAVLEVIK